MTAPYRLPPGPERNFPPWKLVQLRRNILPELERLHASYGDTACIRIAGRNIIFVKHPDDVRKVLVSDHQHFEKSLGMKRLKIFLGEGLLTSEGDFHRRQRKLLQPAFHKEPVRGYAQTMLEYGRAARDRWEDGATVDIDQEMMRLTLAIAGKTLFHRDVEHEAPEVGAALTTLLENYPRLMVPWARLLLKLPTPESRRIRAAIGTLRELITRIVEDRRASGQNEPDLLGMLLAASDEDGAMPAEQVRDEALTLFVAGHETTAVALTWTWYALAQRPETRDGLEEELQRVLDEREPAYEDLQYLEYTRKIIQESMRLYPPAFMMGRTLTTDYTLGEYHLPAHKTMIFVSPYMVQRDPRWYEAPEEFWPERWTLEFEEQLPKFAYFPFGGGPRVCIGSSFAWAEATLLLAQLAQQWRIEPLPNQDLTPNPLITLRPKHGLKAKLLRRDVSINPAPAIAPTQKAECPYHEAIRYTR